MSDSLQVTFWGVRGSIPVPGSSTVKYGGNTPCVSVTTDDSCIILDAGSGIREMAVYLQKNKKTYKNYNILFSHFHHDHLLGFQFFYPLFTEGATINIYAPTLESKYNVREILELQLKRVFFPVKLHEIKSKINYYDFKPGDSLTIDDFKVKTVLLNHPNYAAGYAISRKGKKIVYLTDTEMVNRIFSKQTDYETTTIRDLNHKLNSYADKLIDISYNADVLIFDSQYTEEEYESRQGWGHSTFSDAMFVASRAEVKKLYFFHYDPFHSDEFLDNHFKYLKKEYSYYFDNIDIRMAKERVVVKVK